MADPGASTSRTQNFSQQQLQLQQKQEASRNGRKRRLSMNRKKGNKKGAPKAKEDVDEAPNPMLEPLLHNLRTFPEGKEMKALLSALQPSASDVEMALNIVKDDLRRVLAFPDNQASIYEFGSIKSGLLLKDSDLDFYIHFAQEHNEREGQIKLIHIVGGRMERDGAFKTMAKILGAKVPLLRALHVRTNLQCDINFSNARGCYNSKFIHAVMQFDPRILQLALTVKFWAHCAHVITIHKQMNSYCLVMMLIFFLQTRKLPVIPSVEDMQQGINRINYGPWNLGYPQEIKYTTWNVNTVRELLVSFFKYYSEFDFQKNVISPFVGRLCSIEELEKKTIRELTTYYRAVEREDYPQFIGGPFISIQDPFELNVNVGKVLRTKGLYEQMALSFKHAHDLCQQFRERPFSELLAALFTDTQRYLKPKFDKQALKSNAPSTSTAKPEGGPVNGTTETADSWSICRLPPMENELFFVKEILLARDPERKLLVTDERTRQLWSECMLDFIVDILRKLYMVNMEPIENTDEVESNHVRRFQMSCERQVFLSRKRINITNEAELKKEIEISKARWEKNHALRFSTRIELTKTNGNEIVLRVPNDVPKNGALRLFIDTCFLVNIRKCLRGYFMVMLAKAKVKAQQLATEKQASTDAEVESTDTSASLPEKKDDAGAAAAVGLSPIEPTEENESSIATNQGNGEQLVESSNATNSDRDRKEILAVNSEAS